MGRMESCIVGFEGGVLGIEWFLSLMLGIEWFLSLIYLI
jgi:hypothetical protein